MTNELKSLSPNLMVKDVNKTVDYYKDVLGFNLVVSVPESGTYAWAMVQSGAVTMMFQEEKNLKEEYPILEKFEKGGGLTFYISVSDIHGFYEELKNKATIVKGINKTFYGATEFVVEDINGYILTFSQNDA